MTLDEGIFDHLTSHSGLAALVGKPRVVKKLSRTVSG